MTADAPAGDRGWPALPLAEWQDTRDTLHLWAQLVGKTRLALAPRVNQWWHVPLYVDAAGLTTSLMPLADGRGLEIAFDLHEHALVLRDTAAAMRRLALGPQPMADVFAEYRSHLDALGVDVPLNPLPAEIADAVPFDEDHAARAYDADAARRFHRSLVSAHRVLSRFRAGFSGKNSPVHFFWGAFDLATTRFSGRPAPPHPGGVPNCPDWVMVDAYSQEVSSCGYWPGGAEEGVFYAYAYPEPEGFRRAPAGVPEAYFDDALGEFVLPYAAVRQAAEPDELVLRFLDAVHAAASADWPDRRREESS